jgi:hypothetical protein
MIDCPSHQGIHTDRGVGSNDPLGDTDDLTAPWADDETADASIRNEDIGPSAEHRDRYLTLGGEAKRSHDFLARPGLDEPVSRSPDAKCREPRQRHLTLDARAKQRTE